MTCTVTSPAGSARDTADDAAAETFLTAFRLNGRFDAAKGDRLAWLYGIARNLMRRHRRDEVRGYRAVSRLDPTDSVASHDDRVVTRVSAEHLRGALAAALCSRLNRARGRVRAALDATD